MWVADQTIQTKGASLFCRIFGNGKPLIVNHGGPGLSHDYFLPYLYRLGEFSSVILYDQRGCGRSTGDEMSLEALLEDIETIRKVFHLEKVSLLGHSWGAYLTMQYAIAHPDRVEKLILANSEPATHEGYIQFNEEKGRRIQEKLDPKSQEYLYRVFRHYFYDPAQVEKMDFQRPSRVDIYEYLSDQLLRKPYDLRPALKKLHLPTLVIHGDVDPIPLTAAKEIPHTSFHLIKQCGHFPFVEQPDPFFQAIRGFL